MCLIHAATIDSGSRSRTRVRGCVRVFVSSRSQCARELNDFGRGPSHTAACGKTSPRWQAGFGELR